MKETLKNLLKVKSILTISVTGVFVYMAVTKALPTEVTSATITSVMTYYFTKSKDTQQG